MYRDWLVTSAGVGFPGVRPRPDPVDPDAWRSVLGSLKSERLLGLALSAADRGEIVVDAEQLGELHEAHTEAMGNALRIEQHLVRISDLLQSEEIPLRVLKGTAVAHLDYSDVSLRAFGDADVLLRAADIDRGLAVLSAAGYRRVAPAARSGFDRRFGKGTFLVADDGYEIDVHRTFAMGPYGYTVRPEDLWAAPEEFRIGDRTLLALGPDTRFLHACFHAVVGNPFDRVLPYRDVAEMLLFGEIPVDNVLETASRWRASGVVARACATTWEVLSIDVEPAVVAWARAYVPDEDDRRMMAVYAAHTSYATKSLGSLRVMSWPDRLAFVRLLAGSDRTFSRGRSRASWLIRGGKRVLRDRRTSGYSR